MRGCAALLAAVMMFSPMAARALDFDKSELRIETEAGKTYQFDIELARTPEQMEQGLMFRTKLAPDAGMLFLNDSPQPLQMWMKNTLIPLDMLFIDESGKIVNIEADAQPKTLTTHPSKGPVAAALELNGGTAARLDIQPGDRVVFEAFHNTGMDD